jgi:hypothetical protein|tara:strand:- start:212 stop:451 length:240 start_codon:yes stop_codon:yes gene_type:complete
MVRRWIQRAIIRPGSLSRALEIPKGEKIPSSLLKRIVKASSGDVIKNPTGVGKKKIKVTRSLERKAILALNLKKMSRKR